MPDITITITAEEVVILESFYKTAELGLKNSARRHVKALAAAVIQESTSKFDGNKLSSVELRDEIQRLGAAGEIPTYVERYPELGV
jgi:hypothetical protein